MTPDLYTLPEPCCPVHGGLRYMDALDTWVCHGWDGEGCEHQVAGPDVEWELVAGG